MVSSEQPHFQSLSFAKHSGRSKLLSCLADAFRLCGGALVVFMVVWTLWSSFTPTPTPSFSSPTLPQKFDSATAVNCSGDPIPDLGSYSEERSFYDDPNLSYAIGSAPVREWDEKRKEWLRQNPSFGGAAAASRILMVTGSQAEPCRNPIGDYLLLGLFKNKVDYCRRHGIDIFYNNALLHPEMFSFWAKTAAVRAAMLAHPEAEWIWWVDSDAAFTDMDFAPPLQRYADFNMVVHGWPALLRRRRKSWTAVNAGVFLIRNCQWALDLIDKWAAMGPQSPEYGKWGETLSSVFKDKIFPESDDQSGLIYLYLNEKKWGEKIYVEGEYYLEGYWEEIVDTFDKISERYSEIERKVAALRRRHAEKVSVGYGRVWEEHLKDAGYGKGSWRRPFITHFTGCQPCSGDHNHMYSFKTCLDAMRTALAFADNQVLRNYGFMHPDLRHPPTVTPFHYPPAT